MKWLVMNVFITYLVSAADSSGQDQGHITLQKILRAVFWPITLNSWARTGNDRLHRLLTLLWVCLTAGWILSLMADRL